MSVVDGLCELVESTCTELTQLWDEIGSLSDDRTRQLRKLRSGIEEQLRTHVGTVVEQRDYLLNKINIKLGPLLKSLEESLDIKADDCPSGPPSRPLLSQCEEMQRQIKKLQVVLHERFNEMHEGCPRLSELLHSLGENPTAEDAVMLAVFSEESDESFDLSQPLTLNRIGQMRQRIASLESTKKQRLLTAQRIASDVISLLGQMGELEQAPESARVISANIPFPEGDPTPFDEFVWCVMNGKEASTVVLTDQFHIQLQHRLKSCETELARRQECVQTILTRLEQLWRRVLPSENEILPIVDLAKQKKPTLEIISKLEGEVAEYTKRKSNMMDQLIESAYSRLRQLWDSLHLPQEMRDEFDAFVQHLSGTSEAEQDAVLSQIEQQIESRTAHEVAYSNINRLVMKREQYKSEIKEVEEQANDPSRLLARSHRGDPGRLLREEKLRKIGSTTLPLLTQKIREEIANFEHQTALPFLVSVTDSSDREADSTQFRHYLDIIDEDEANDLRKKQEEKEKRDRSRVHLNSSNSSNNTVVSTPRTAARQQHQQFSSSFDGSATPPVITNENAYPHPTTGKTTSSTPGFLSPKKFSSQTMKKTGASTTPTSTLAKPRMDTLHGTPRYALSPRNINDESTENEIDNKKRKRFMPPVTPGAENKPSDTPHGGGSKKRFKVDGVPLLNLSDIGGSVTEL